VKTNEKMIDGKEQTYDFVCFTDLAYEFNFSERKDIEKKIKKRLKYCKLGEYNQDRVDYIRQLKNDLYSEISQTTKSKYFQKSKSNYADLADFNIDRMAMDYSKKYDKVERNELRAMINYAIYLYHMR
jgi:hypothetical protein